MVIKRAFAIGVASGALALAAMGLVRVEAADEAPAGPPAVPVAVRALQPREAPAWIEAVGELRAVNEVLVAPEVAGRVVDIQFEAGQRVEKGALLVRLYDAPEKAERAAAAARAELAEQQLVRARDLQARGAGSQERLDQRRAELDEARAQVRLLDARLAQKEVRAPFAGEIGVRRVNLGQYVNPGDAVAMLAAQDRLFVNFAVPQQEIGRLRVGSTVQVTTDAWPDRRFVARIGALEPTIAGDTRNVWVQATLDNDDGALRPGMYITAEVQLPPEASALIVPATAIVTSASGETVLVVRGLENGEGTAEIVPVKTGRRIREEVVVADGLKPGDVIVTEGQIRVQPGARVKAVAPQKTSLSTAE